MLDALELAPTPSFQPIVSFPDGALVGFEALARWPTLGNPDPDLVFDYASKDPALLAALDERCITGALDTVLEAGFGAGALVFINTYPACELPGEAIDARAERLAARRLRLVFELTERHLLASPRTLIDKVEAIRRRGWAIAFDDVGVNSAALPLLDVLRPEIIKLDMNLVRSVPREHTSQVMPAVLTYRERTNAVILAEGLETNAQYTRALGWGATLGQGHLFGRPGPLTTKRVIRWGDVKVPTAPRPEAPQAADSPFDMLIATGAQSRQALMPAIEALARHVRVISTLHENPSIALAVLPDDDRVRFTETGLQSLGRAAPAISFFAVFGPNLPPQLAEFGIRTIAIAPPDPLSKEMLFLALGPHAAAAIAIRGFDLDSRPDYVVTYDRQHVTRIASHLLARIP
jgi:EAL domain-containing protein (putative c-di-GMP-specific phosphodiesterase class I)